MRMKLAVLVRRWLETDCICVLLLSHFEQVPHVIIYGFLAAKRRNTMYPDSALVQFRLPTLLS